MRSQRKPQVARTPSILSAQQTTFPVTALLRDGDGEDDVGVDDEHCRDIDLKGLSLMNLSLRFSLEEGVVVVVVACPGQGSC